MLDGAIYDNTDARINLHTTSRAIWFGTKLSGLFDFLNSVCEEIYPFILFSMKRSY